MGAGRGQGSQLAHVQSSGTHPDEDFPSFADIVQSALCPREAGPASKLLQAPDLQAVAGKALALALGPPSVSEFAVTGEHCGCQEQVWGRPNGLIQVWWMLQVLPPGYFSHLFLGSSKGTSIFCVAF